MAVAQYLVISRPRADKIKLRVTDRVGSSSERTYRIERGIQAVQRFCSGSDCFSLDQAGRFLTSRACCLRLVRSW